MDLSIIVTHHNTPELLDVCIKSIKNSIKGIKHEIIIADSGPTEESREFIKDLYSDIKLVSFKNNVGYSKIVNAAINKTRGDYILILNADIVVLEGSIIKMLKYIKSHPRVGIVGPQLIDFIGNVQISCFSKPTLGAIIARRTFLGKLDWGKKRLERFSINDRDKQTIKKVDWLQGAAIMIRKEAAKKVGPWDERFFMYFEDADWCRRFWQNGYGVVYLPSAQMAHYYHRSSKKWGGLLDLFFNKYTRIHLISALKYFWKYRHAK